MTLAASIVHQTTPSTFTAWWRRQCSSVSSSNGSGSAMPAWAHITSIEPKRSTHSSTARRQSSRRDTSPWKATQRPPSDPTVWSSRSAFTSKATTPAPSRTNRCAMPRPIPCAAPVTTTPREVPALPAPRSPCADIGWGLWGSAEPTGCTPKARNPGARACPPPARSDRKPVSVLLGGLHALGHRVAGAREERLAAARDHRHQHEDAGDEPQQHDQRRELDRPGRQRVQRVVHDEPERDGA